MRELVLFEVCFFWEMARGRETLVSTRIVLMNLKHSCTSSGPTLINDNCQTISPLICSFVAARDKCIVGDFPQPSVCMLLHFQCMPNRSPQLINQWISCSSLFFFYTALQSKPSLVSPVMQYCLSSAYVLRLLKIWKVWSESEIGQ